ncbi:PREDICTED: glycine-rich protein HC1-like [Prunus mume]|uniref:Glycine-rich protein HC1-like n=1 Tax=Prunus mume TaxID=102107 RepID=A0ABM1LL46_PRUMU|nr:PREDICTED: glycine-rich protein HC1-like [Prunus mume]
MASSKTFLLLGLVCVVLILIVSEASARELAETTTQINQNNAYERNGHGGHVVYGRGGYNRGGQGTYGRGVYNRGIKGGHGRERDPYSRGGKGYGRDHGHYESPGPGTAETETKN